MFVRKTGAPLRIAYTTKPLKANALYPLFASILQTLLYNNYTLSMQHIVYVLSYMRNAIARNVVIHYRVCLCVCVPEKRIFVFTFIGISTHCGWLQKRTSTCVTYIFSEVRILYAAQMFSREYAHILKPTCTIPTICEYECERDFRVLCVCVLVLVYFAGGQRGYPIPRDLYIRFSIILYSIGYGVA